MPHISITVDTVGAVELPSRVFRRRSAGFDELRLLIDSQNKLRWRLHLQASSAPDKLEFVSIPARKDDCVIAVHYSGTLVAGFGAEPNSFLEIATGGCHFLACVKEKTAIVAVGWSNIVLVSNDLLVTYAQHDWADFYKIALDGNTLTIDGEIPGAGREVSTYRLSSDGGIRRLP